MLFTAFRLLLAAVGAIVGVVVVLFFLTFFAALGGSPGECDSRGREVQISAPLARQLQAKLDRFHEQLDTGQAASVTFDESEATSRGREFLEEKDAPIENLKVCFNPEGPSASGKVSELGTVHNATANVKVFGKVNLSGEHPRVDDFDIHVAQLPGFVTGGLERIIRDVILEGTIKDVVNDQLDHIDIEHQLTITFGEGTATLSGQP